MWMGKSGQQPGLPDPPVNPPVQPPPDAPVPVEEPPQPIPLPTPENPPPSKRQSAFVRVSGGEMNEKGKATVKLKSAEWYVWPETISLIRFKRHHSA